MIPQQHSIQHEQLQNVSYDLTPRIQFINKIHSIVKELSLIIILSEETQSENPTHLPSFQLSRTQHHKLFPTQIRTKFN